MTSIGANVLLYSYSEASPHHAAAKAFVESLSQRDDATLWNAAASADFARRRIYDTRTALCLQAFGVTDFAT